MGRGGAMKKNKEIKGHEIQQDSKEESLTRRKAIKRIAAILAGAAVSVPMLGQASKELQFAYLSRAPYDPYADSVRVPTYRDHVRYSSFYSSHHRYHSIYVPPPYSSRK